MHHYSISRWFVTCITRSGYKIYSQISFEPDLLNTGEYRRDIIRGRQISHRLFLGNTSDMYITEGADSVGD